MYPVLFSYKGLQISSYGLMLVVAFLTCNYLLRRDLIKKNKNPDIADDIIFRAAIGGVLGAKIYYLLENINNGIAAENIKGFLSIFKGILTLDFSTIALGIQNFGSGMVFLGGLIGGMISVSLYLKKNNIPWLEGADWVAPYLILGHAIGRLGCFLVGDCYGTTCNLPWAVSFPNGLPPTTFESFQYNYPSVFNTEHFQAAYSAGDIIYVHPTQLYEFCTGILIFSYLIYIRKKEHYSGLIMFEYLFLAGLARFLVEFIRLNPGYILGLSGAQIISAGMMGVSTYFMYVNRKKISIN